MSNKDWSKMTPRERDAWIAEWMGITVYRDTHTISDEVVLVGAYDGPKDNEQATRILDYTTDPVAARLILDEVNQRGLHERFVQSLIHVMSMSAPHAPISHFRAFHLIHSTPDQQCEAIWRIAQAGQCEVCGQSGCGQTGEYPCATCGRPRLHDPLPVTET